MAHTLGYTSENTIYLNSTTYMCKLYICTKNDIDLICFANLKPIEILETRDRIEVSDILLYIIYIKKIPVSKELTLILCF